MSARATLAGFRVVDQTPRPKVIDHHLWRNVLMTLHDFSHAARSCIYLILTLLLSACATPGLQQRQAESALLASNAGWQPVLLDTGTFVLTAFVPPGLQQASTLTVYIEGDGLAWLNSSTPSLRSSRPSHAIAISATPIPASKALTISAQALATCKRHRHAAAMAPKPNSMPPCSLSQRRSQGWVKGTRPMHSTGNAVSSAAC